MPEFVGELAEEGAAVGAVLLLGVVAGGHVDGVVAGAVHGGLVPFPLAAGGFGLLGHGDHGRQADRQVGGAQRGRPHPHQAGRGGLVEGVLGGEVGGEPG